MFSWWYTFVWQKGSNAYVKWLIYLHYSAMVKQSRKPFSGNVGISLLFRYSSPAGFVNLALLAVQKLIQLIFFFCYVSQITSAERIAKVLLTTPAAPSWAEQKLPTRTSIDMQDLGLKLAVWFLNAAICSTSEKISTKIESTALRISWEERWDRDKRFIPH